MRLRMRIACASVCALDARMQANAFTCIRACVRMHSYTNAFACVRMRKRMRSNAHAFASASTSASASAQARCRTVLCKSSPYFVDELNIYFDPRRRVKETGAKTKTYY